MDRVDRRSLAVSTALHALVATATLIGSAASAPPQLELPQAAPPPQTSATEVILTPEREASSAASAQDPALPTLGARDLPTFDVPVIAPSPTGLPDGAGSRGRGGNATAKLELPSVGGIEDSLSKELRARTSSPALDAETDREVTAANFIDIQLRRARPKWRAFEADMTNRLLVLRVRVDAQGRVVEALLDPSNPRNTTGVQALDRTIEAWAATLSLPPIAADHPHRFLLSLERH
jgi:hypothetical protein